MSKRSPWLVIIPTALTEGFLIGALHLPFWLGQIILLGTGMLLMTIHSLKRRRQPAQLEAHKSRLERIRDDYAEGTLTTEQMEQSIERELYAQAHAIEPAKPATALPEPAIDWERERKRQPTPYIPGPIDTSYMEAANKEWLWRTREDRV